MDFGRKQLKNPTPAKIVFWVRVYSVVAGILITSLASAPFHIPHEAGVNWLLGLSIGVSNGIAPLFGVEVSGNRIPKDQVTSMEEKP
jgi:hypothetical protein